MKKEHLQKTFNDQELDYDVYWFVYFTWVYPNNKEQDFKSVIKASSAKNARQILANKVNRDEEGSKIISVKTYRIHSKYNIKNHDSSLSIEQWDAIRASAFPNEYDELFLIKKIRKEGAQNYFGRVYDEKFREQARKFGFQKGEKNWNYLNPICQDNVPAEHERHLFRAKKTGRRGQDWERIPEEERRAERAEIARVLVEANGNRTAASRLLGVDKKVLWKRMKRHPEIDWNKLYPIGGRPKRTEEHTRKIAESFKKQYKKENHHFYGRKLSEEHRRKITESNLKTKGKKFKGLQDKLIRLLKKHNNVRKNVAEELGVSKETLYCYFKRFKDIDWKNDFPSPYSKKSK